jgi:outer membrane protein insertion porin family
LLATTASTALADIIAESSAYKGWTVSALEIRGVEESLVSGLKKGLVLSGESKLLGRKMPTYYPQLLEEDIGRSRLYLARRGYPYAEAVPRFEPSASGRKLGIVLDFTSGPRVDIESVSVEGMPASLKEKADVSGHVRAGSRFSEEDVSGASASLLSLLRHSGHARAEVEPAVHRSDSTHVRLDFLVSPGSIYRFSEVTVEGISPDLVPLVKKTIALEKGALYSPAVLREAEDYLRLLNLFGGIRLTTPESGSQSLDIHADLSQRKPRTPEANVGYWTDDLVKVGARWYHRNLLRAGRGLEVKGSFSRFAQNIGTALNWPGLYGSRTWGLADLMHERETEESYDLQSTELELAGVYRPTLTTSLRAGFSVSDVDVDVETEDPEAFVEQGGLLTTVSLEWTRDNSDNRLSPTRGTIHRTRVEWAPQGAISESHYILLEGGSTLYLPLGRGVVAAGRLGVGAAEPLGESVDLLPNKRFYSGGVTSMRGFKRRKLGPLDEEEAPLGGEARLEAAFELRFPIIWRLGGALFVDTGQVWRRSEDASLDDMEVAVGPGLMIRTPIGPIRGDWGYRLTDVEPTQPKSVYHVSIGHPF